MAELVRATATRYRELSTDAYRCLEVRVNAGSSPALSTMQ